ncbi:MAG: ThuA domain-containing protein [Opitutae bacterium]|nr:ThuA domain-containing protein [Opitutae bacterium]
MHRLRFLCSRLIAALLVMTAFVSVGRASDAAMRPLRVLFFSKSANFEHSVVKRVDGQPSWAEQILGELGKKRGYEFTFTKDGSQITPEFLTKFDVLFFYTCGFFTNDVPNVDGQPPMSEAGLRAVYDAVAAGKGFVGCHSASDCLHTGEQPQVNFQTEPGRWVNHGAASHPWVRFLGGEFIRHGAQQATEIRVVSPEFPGLKALPAATRFAEEWYSLKDFAPDLHVVHLMETAGMEGLEYRRPAFPCTWARRHGKGRVFYTSLGHREDVWASEFFQTTIAAGLNWAGGRVEADVTPNLERVAPGARQLPPTPPDAK